MSVARWTAPLRSERLNRLKGIEFYTQIMLYNAPLLESIIFISIGETISSVEENSLLICVVFLLPTQQLPADDVQVCK